MHIDNILNTFQQLIVINLYFINLPRPDLDKPMFNELWNTTDVLCRLQHADFIQDVLFTPKNPMIFNTILFIIPLCQIANSTMTNKSLTRKYHFKNVICVVIDQDSANWLSRKGSMKRIIRDILLRKVEYRINLGQGGGGYF